MDFLFLCYNGKKFHMMKMAFLRGDLHNIVHHLYQDFKEITDTEKKRLRRYLVVTGKTIDDIGVV